MIPRKIFFLSLVFFLSGCANKAVNVADATPDPMRVQKNEFFENYSAYITEGDRKKLEGIRDRSGFDEFVANFFKVRDPDPLTPENEFKDLADERIDDIKNEIFFADPDILGTRFVDNNGLRGEMARIYLYYGVPHYKSKLSEGRTHVSLMVWYYFDFEGRPLFSFLFYEKFGRLLLFKSYGLLTSESLWSPMVSPLKDISLNAMPNSEELIELWEELSFKDPEGAFRGALFQFSYYTDVVIYGGNGRNRFGALDVPEPAAFTAAASKPVIVGQPGNLEKRTFMNNQFNSFIPADLRITGDRPSFEIGLDYRHVDWEIKGDKAEAVLNLRISFQHIESRKMTEFIVSLAIMKSVQEVEEKRLGVEVQTQAGPRRKYITIYINLDDAKNYFENKEGRTLRQLIDSLEAGKYVVNIDLRHAVTKKYIGGWREEITIR